MCFIQDTEISKWTNFLTMNKMNPQTQTEANNNVRKYLKRELNAFNEQCEHHITNKGVCAACGKSDMSQNDCY